MVWTQNINYYSDQPLHYETYHHHDHKLGTLGIWGADFTGESCGALIQYTIVQCEMLHMDSVKRHYGNISRNIVDSFSNANTRGQRTEITQRTLSDSTQEPRRRSRRWRHSTFQVPGAQQSGECSGILKCGSGIPLKSKHFVAERKSCREDVGVRWGKK